MECSFVPKRLKSINLQDEKLENDCHFCAVGVYVSFWYIETRVDLMQGLYTICRNVVKFGRKNLAFKKGPDS